jgi:hypothetical protein
MTMRIASPPRLLARLAGLGLALCAFAGAARATQSDPVLEVGRDTRSAFHVSLPSLKRQGDLVSYLLRWESNDGSSGAQSFVVDCRRRERAPLRHPDDPPSAHAVPMSPVGYGNRDSIELWAVCNAAPQAAGAQAAPAPTLDRPGGRRPDAAADLGAGVIVTAGGVVLAPRLALLNCPHVDALVGGRRIPAGVLALEADLALLQIDGGPYAPLPLRKTGFGASEAVTLVGARGGQFRIGAGLALPPGSNPDDQGWPQVALLPDTVVANGAVWDFYGRVIGFAASVSGGDAQRRMLRLIPLGTVEQMLAEHGVSWQNGGYLPTPDLDTAVLRAVATTVPLVCHGA